MKQVLLLVLVLMGFAMADTYTLTIDQQGGQGTATLPTTTTIKYQHDGTVIPTSPNWVDDQQGVLDSIQIHATDEAGNVGTALLFIKIMPVNDNAPVVQSDTLMCLEGQSVDYTPIVTDADNKN